MSDINKTPWPDFIKFVVNEAKSEEWEEGALVLPMDEAHKLLMSKKYRKHLSDQAK